MHFCLRSSAGCNLAAAHNLTSLVYRSCFLHASFCTPLPLRSARVLTLPHYRYPHAPHSAVYAGFVPHAVTPFVFCRFCVIPTAAPSSLHGYITSPPFPHRTAFLPLPGSPHLHGLRFRLPWFYSALHLFTPRLLTAATSASLRFPFVHRFLAFTVGSFSRFTTPPPALVLILPLVLAYTHAIVKHRCAVRRSPPRGLHRTPHYPRRCHCHCVYYLRSSPALRCYLCNTYTTACTHRSFYRTYQHAACTAVVLRLHTLRLLLLPLTAAVHLDLCVRFTCAYTHTTFSASPPGFLFTIVRRFTDTWFTRITHLPHFTLCGSAHIRLVAPPLPLAAAHLHRFCTYHCCLSPLYLHFFHLTCRSVVLVPTAALCRLPVSGSLYTSFLYAPFLPFTSALPVLWIWFSAPGLDSAHLRFCTSLLRVLPPLLPLRFSAAGSAACRCAYRTVHAVTVYRVPGFRFHHHAASSVPSTCGSTLRSRLHAVFTCLLHYYHRIFSYGSVPAGLHTRVTVNTPPRTVYHVLHWIFVFLCSAPAPFWCGSSCVPARSGSRAPDSLFRSSCTVRYLLQVIRSCRVPACVTVPARYACTADFHRTFSATAFARSCRRSFTTSVYRTAFLPVRCYRSACVPAVLPFHFHYYAFCTLLPFTPVPSRSRFSAPGFTLPSAPMRSWDFHTCTPSLPPDLPYGSFPRSGSRRSVACFTHHYRYVRYKFIQCNSPVSGYTADLSRSAAATTVLPFAVHFTVARLRFRAIPRISAFTTPHLSATGHTGHHLAVHAYLPHTCCSPPAATCWFTFGCVSYTTVLPWKLLRLPLVTAAPFSLPALGYCTVLSAPHRSFTVLHRFTSAAPPPLCRTVSARASFCLCCTCASVFTRSPNLRHVLTVDTRSFLPPSCLSSAVYCVTSFVHIWILHVLHVGFLCAYLLAHLLWVLLLIPALPRCLVLLPGSVRSLPGFAAVLCWFNTSCCCWFAPLHLPPLSLPLLGSCTCTRTPADTPLHHRVLHRSASPHLVCTPWCRSVTAGFHRGSRSAVPRTAHRLVLDKLTAACHQDYTTRSAQVLYQLLVLPPALAFSQVCCRITAPRYWFCCG